MVTDRARTGAFVLLTLAATAVGLRLLAVPCPWGSGECLLPHEPVAWAWLRWVLAVMAVFHALVIPGWLLATIVGAPPLVRLGLAVPLSTAVWIILHVVLHVVGVPRVGVAAAAALGVTECVLVAAGRRKFLPGRGEIAALLVGIAVLAVFGPGRMASQSLDGDGVEAFGFAASLRTRLLPFWDLENGTWGFYPAFMSFAYPVQLVIGLLGESEAATRLAVLPLTVALAAMVGAGRTGLARGVLMGAALVVVATSGLNYTYEPYAADVAEPTVTDLFFTASLLGLAWAWRERRIGMFALTATLAVTGQPAGMPFAGLLVAGGLLSRETRPFALRAGCALAVILLARGCVGQWCNPPGSTKFSPRVFLAHHALSSHLGLRQVATQAYALLVQTSALPVVFVGSYVRDLRRKPDRAIHLAVAIYLAAALLSPNRHPHYLTPIAALLLFLLPQQVTMPRLGAVMVVLAFLGILPPWNRPIDTSAADFSRATMMVFPNEREATENADLLYRVLTVPPWRDERQWGIGKHAWVLYARHSRRRPESPPPGVHVLFTHEPRPWHGFVPVTDNERAYMYESPEGWMESWKDRQTPTTNWGILLTLPGRIWDPLTRWKH